MQDDDEAGEVAVTDIKIAAEQSIRDFLALKFPPGSAPSPDQIKAALMEYAETKPLNDPILVTRASDDPNRLLVTLPTHLADIMRPRFTPADCPHCEYDRRFPGFTSGGWLQQDNNGPIVSCPVCNDDGKHPRE